MAKYLSPKEARRYDTFIHYGMAATIDAVADAGLAAYAGDKERVGVCIGSGIGGLPLIEETKDAFEAGGWRKITPFFVPGSIINMVAGLASIQYGFQGPEPRDRLRVLVVEPLHRRGGAPDRVRRRRRDGRRRHRGDGQRARHRRLLRGARAVDAQRRSRDGEPAVGRRPRRLRAGRGRRRPGARGIRARESARRADLLRARRLRNERRRAPHHRAARRRPRRGAQHAERAAQRRPQRRRHRLHQRPRHVDAARRHRRVHRHQARLRRAARRSSPSARPSR